MFMVIGEFLLCCFVLVGSFLLAKSHPQIAGGLFLGYVVLMLCNYFVVRWKYEGLKRSVMKFKKWRKKVSSFDFGLPNPAMKTTDSSSQTPAPKKSK